MPRCATRDFAPLALSVDDLLPADIELLMGYRGALAAEDGAAALGRRLRAFPHLMGKLDGMRIVPTEGRFALAVGVFFSPALVYPCLFASCCLQYTVAQFRLGPGYPNLLGFGFVRASLSLIAAALALFGWLRVARVDGLFLLLVICF